MFDENGNEIKEVRYRSIREHRRNYNDFKVRYK